MLSDRTTTNGTPDLADSLRSLGLWLVADELDDFMARSTKNRSSVRQVLEELCRLELQERARKSVERRLRRSRVGRFKPMADFDWEWPEKIDRGAIERILTLGFMERAENVVLVASQGLGKTMIAKNLVHAAAQRGANAVFTTAADLLLDLSKQETARALERRLRYYSQPQILAIDEVGYLSYDNHAADLLFQIVSRRYERRSIHRAHRSPDAPRRDRDHEGRELSQARGGTRPEGTPAWRLNLCVSSRLPRCDPMPIAGAGSWNRCGVVKGWASSAGRPSAARRGSGSIWPSASRAERPAWGASPSQSPGPSCSMGPRIRRHSCAIGSAASPRRADWTSPRSISASSWRTLSGSTPSGIASA
jgi:DNA replication protein DnaC